MLNEGFREGKRMSTAIKQNKLHPYAAFLLFTRDAAPINGLKLKDIAATLQNDMTVAGCIELQSSEQVTADGMDAWALHFKVTSQASWSSDDKLKNVAQHLVVLAFHDSVLGVAASDGELRDSARDILKGVTGLALIAADHLENALLRERQLGALWMRGVHRKSPFKASSKVLYGPQVQSSLNALDDRTFLPSSARADTDGMAGGKLKKLGVSPERSYVWLGPTNDLNDFGAYFKQLVEYIKVRGATKRTALPVLTKGLSVAPKPGKANEAFDFDFISAATAPDLNDKLRELLEAVELCLSIRTVGKKTTHNFSLFVTDTDQQNSPEEPEWQINVSINLSDGSVSSTVNKQTAERWTRWKALSRLLAKRSLWSVWYETGHCFSNGMWTLLDVRASHYEGHLIGVDFTAGNWLVDKEKPQDKAEVIWQNIGNDKTLFSWCLLEGMTACFPSFMKSADRASFAYAICDDGSNELGDFIMLAKDKSFATSINPSDFAIVLFHVKSASSAQDRAMAPKRYEEVLGQATKNLGRIQFPYTKDYLLQRLTGAHAMLWEWKANAFNLKLMRGEPLSEKEKVRNVLDAFDGRRVHVHVIVVQPHQEVGALASAMGASPVDFKTRMLCTLLCAADGAARASSSTLSVVMSKAPLPSDTKPPKPFKRKAAKKSDS
jgi:hypothetical protein